VLISSGTLITFGSYSLAVSEEVARKFVWLTKIQQQRFSFAVFEAMSEQAGDRFGGGLSR
jgi:hypothetical protein